MKLKYVSSLGKFKIFLIRNKKQKTKKQKSYDIIFRKLTTAQSFKIQYL